MNTNLLYTILQACNYSSTLSEIADKLYLSQPYISKVLKRAEKEYGTTLVNRKETPITLTKSGLLVLEHLQIIYEAELDLKKALLQNKANQERPLNLLITNPFLYPAVLDILTKRSQKDPTFYFNLSSNPIAEPTVKIIANHHFDLIIGRKYIDSGLITLPLPSKPVYVFILKVESTKTGQIPYGIRLCYA
ncbi:MULTISPECIES: LysR family transcriptional regulator [Lactobacillus]|uniref:LysR family transcriptional regulator n=1 Tax=Lactobacillus xujianguonis TaxID=2495899 RepID=A0A437SSU3_9LACO|nr:MULTISPECIES: LysR family transcriptional regulator [Lactobacillus]RVU69978.1 LysR family transcriptional regulator [Lactobacillus xujianguonis]RVU72384.1 LysR family transcriptional regulator [Lactobacillus xujianguonis]